VVVFVLLFSLSIVFKNLPPENTILKLNNNTKTHTRKHNTKAELKIQNYHQKHNAEAEP
jgi:hypothetical protein